MREILYRGKRKDNSEWVYGCLVKLGKMSFSDDDRFGICNKAIPVGSGVVYNLNITEIAPETIGQYTGVKDKNGMKIFEGDILECQIWFEYGCYPHSETSYREVTMPDIYMVNIDQNIEVVGNKFDNPELSKQKNSDRIYADFNKKDEV